MSEFFKLHSGLPREGPGQEADVKWAIGVSRIEEISSVLDAGCGPGADTVTLATLLSNARITAVDAHPGFIEEAKSRLAEFGPRVSAECRDMFDQTANFDLIWCAAALYFAGITNGLKTFRNNLSPQGAIAFSEIVWTKDSPPEIVSSYWSEYPEMTDISGTRKRIELAGFEIVGERILGNRSWRNRPTIRAEYEFPKGFRCRSVWDFPGSFLLATASRPVR